MSAVAVRGALKFQSLLSLAWQFYNLGPLEVIFEFSGNYQANQTVLQRTLPIMWCVLQLQGAASPLLGVHMIVTT